MGARRPEEQSLQTRRHTYNRIRQVFDFAESSLRLRVDGSNPFTKRLRPRKVKGIDVSKADVLLARRVFYMLAVATGFDVITLPLRSWADIDPQNRTLQEVRPKSGKNVFAYANPAWLFEGLEAWRTVSGAPAADAPREVLKASPIVPPEVLD
jgi:hypothetical protein